jgi:hypothetical protein
MGLLHETPNKNVMNTGKSYAEPSEKEETETDLGFPKTTAGGREFLRGRRDSSDAGFGQVGTTTRQLRPATYS